MIYEEVSKAMYAPVNVLEIASDYLRHMRKDLRPVPFIIVLVILPAAIGWLLYFAGDGVRDCIVLGSVIMMVGLMNLMAVVFIVAARGLEEEELEFVEHLSSTISMTALTAGAVWVLTVAGFMVLVFYATGFLIVNVTVILVRLHRLVRHRISKILYTT